MRYALAVLLALSSHAWDKPQKPVKETPDDRSVTSRSDSRAYSNSRSASTSDARAAVGDVSATGGTASATGGNASVGDVGSDVIVGDISGGTTSSQSFSGDSSSTVNIQHKQRRQAPGVVLGSTYASNPCWQPGRSFGGSGPGIGGGYQGKGKPDERCNVREWARVFSGTPDPIARYVLCHEPQALNVFETADACMTYGYQTSSEGPDYSAIVEDQQAQIRALEATLKRQAQILAGLSENDAKQSKLLEQKSRPVAKDRHDRPQLAALKAKVEAEYQ